ncbi:UNVERIFIED_ORG: hypothetical protein B5F06_06410 [Lacrimispora saccharolytica]
MDQDSRQADSPVRACRQHEIEWYRARGSSLASLCRTSRERQGFLYFTGNGCLYFHERKRWQEWLPRL